MPTYATDISISEIVQEERGLAELAIDRSVYSEKHGNQVKHQSPPIENQSQSSCLPPKQSSPVAVINKPEQGARTLHQRRNLHSHIRVLRENWNALRNGSVTFSSSMLNSGGRNNNTRNNTKARIHGNSSEQQPSVSKMAGKDTVSMSALTENSYDIERAWKMMKIAKSIEGNTGDAGSGNNCTPNCPVSKRKVLKEGRNEDLSSAILRNKPSILKSEGGIASEKCQKDQARNQNLSPSILDSKPSIHKAKGGLLSERCKKDHCSELVHKNCKSRECEKHKPMIAMKDMQQVDTRFPASHVSSYCELKSSKQVMKSFQEGVSHLAMCELSNLNNGGNAPRCSCHITDSLPRAPDQSLSRTKPIVSSNFKVDPSRGIVGAYRKVDGTQRKDDGAKCEVQSLVKLNLKLLSNDKQLGMHYCI